MKKKAEWVVEKDWGIEMNDWAIIPAVIFHVDFHYKDFSIMVQIGPLWAQLSVEIYTDFCEGCGEPIIGVGIRGLCFNCAMLKAAEAMTAEENDRPEHWFD